MTGAARRTGLRSLLVHDFDHVTLLADSLDTVRTGSAGFDGVAIYDNYVRPDSWPGHAAACGARDLLFSFNVNPGFDGIVLREVEPDSCYVPPGFEPPTGLIAWAEAAERERAGRLGLDRVTESLVTTVSLQADPLLPNARHGFFLVYVNSFNEWHEGHQFEPMMPARDLTPAQRRIGYHNPEVGDVRLRSLAGLLEPILRHGELPGEPSERPVASAACSRCIPAEL